MCHHPFAIIRAENDAPRSPHQRCKTHTRQCSHPAVLYVPVVVVLSLIGRGVNAIVQHARGARAPGNGALAAMETGVTMLAALLLLLCSLYFPVH